MQGLMNGSSPAGGNVERILLVLSIGHSGSAWLAKLLNSHFDVVCFHDLELVSFSEAYPPRAKCYFQFTPEEKCRNIHYLFARNHNYTRAYKVLACVSTHVEEDVCTLRSTIAAAYPDSESLSRFVVLLRNPISQIHSSAAAITNMGWAISDRAEWEAFHDRQSRPVLARLPASSAAALDTVFCAGTQEDRCFVHACLRYLQHLWSAHDLADQVSYPCVVRLEHAARDMTYLEATLQEMTGLEYRLPPRALDKVNVKSGARAPDELFLTWPEARRELFQMVFQGQSHLLDRFGYSVEALSRYEPSRGPLWTVTRAS